MTTKQTDKATARPWHVQNEGSQTIIASQTALDSDAGGPAVCYIYNHETKGSRANAHLICRAVNEHSALCAVAEALKALVDPYDGNLDGAPTSIKLARQALSLLASVRNS